MDLLDWLEQFSVVYLLYSEIAMVLFHFTLWLVEKKNSREPLNQSDANPESTAPWSSSSFRA